MKKSMITAILLVAAFVSLSGCGKQESYQKEITEAWTKSNSYDSASYTYNNSYTNAEGASVVTEIVGAYNKKEEAWSQISSYGTEGIGKKEEVFSNDGVFIRYNLDGETWEAWGTLESERPDYASYLTNLFEQEISFENIASITKEERDGEYVYTLLYEENYMEEQVKEELTAAEAYLEVLDSSSASEEEVETIETRIANLELMAEAEGQVIYYVDKDGNLTGLGSKMLMKNGGGTSAILRLAEFGEVSFEGYVQNP